MKIVRKVEWLTPASPNGLKLVYMLGYGGRIWHSKRHLKMLLNEGYEILVMDFYDALRRRDPQDLLTLMDEVDSLFAQYKLIDTKTMMVGVSMGGLVGFNMMKRHKELKVLLAITGGNMALIPKYYKQKWPVSYDELAEIWAPANIYTKPGEITGRYVAMVLPSRDKVIDPDEVVDELKKLGEYNTVVVLRPKGGHFRTIITETILRPRKSLHIIHEMKKLVQ